MMLDRCPSRTRLPRSRVVRALAWGGLAAAILVGAALLRPFGWGTSDPNQASAFGLLAQAAAAEEHVFQGPGVKYVENEIVVHPVSDAGLAKARWLPLAALLPDGELEIQQMTLAADVGQGYTLKDQTWYDPATGHFSRVLWEGDQAVFAGSYDGEAVYRLQTKAGTKSSIERLPVTEGFQRPQRLAEVLGLAAGLPTDLEAQDSSAAMHVACAGESQLDDGSTADILKVAYASPDANGSAPAYFLFTIRRTDKTIAAMEFRSDKESLFVVRRVKVAEVARPEVSWDLSEINRLGAEGQPAPQVGFRRGMVKMDVSVEEMIEVAGFETYLFSPPPSWTEKRTLVDVLDVASPPKRMFVVCEVAADGRHVVLVQSPTYNSMARMMVAQAELAYTSPSGVKVWSSSRGPWLAGILLQSAMMVTREKPADDRTGYLLETPAGTFPALAVNGKITDDELHTLVDSLMPAGKTIK